MKTWWKSKTLWINAIAIGSIIIRAEYGLVLTVENEIIILAVINWVLRKVTKEDIVWKAY